MPATLDAATIRRLRARGDAPPLAPRLALCDARGAVFGSVEPALAQAMHAAGLPLVVDADADGLRVEAPFDAALERIARWLSATRLDGRWRGERLAVTDAQGRVLGAIERAVVRPLGIATHAVHLVGHTRDGRVWLQQRAADKAVDPGRWDTLMGGLMAAGETVAETLARETWEEAGLHIAQLGEVAEYARRTVRRPLADGYMIEHMHAWSALVPESIQPVNQDGEVQRFEPIDRATLRAWLADDRFTLEAALVLLDWDERHPEPTR